MEICFLYASAVNNVICTLLLQNASKKYLEYFEGKCMFVIIHKGYEPWFRDGIR
jgi:hypothetical protein